MTSASRILRTRSAPRRGEQGYASIEIVGIAPIAVLVCGFIFELFLVVLAGIEAESSARLAARELSKGASAAQAEQAAVAGVPGIFDARASIESSSQLGTGVAEEPGVQGTALENPASATVTVDVPFLGFGFDPFDLELTRHAVMPATD